MYKNFILKIIHSFNVLNKLNMKKLNHFIFIILKVFELTF